jgi:hypothetical protein
VNVLKEEGVKVNEVVNDEKEVKYKRNEINSGFLDVNDVKKKNVEIKDEVRNEDNEGKIIEEKEVKVIDKKEKNKMESMMIRI